MNHLKACWDAFQLFGSVFAELAQGTALESTPPLERLVRV
jgi:hypothetical protein